MLPFVKENVPTLLLQPARLAFYANLHLRLPGDEEMSNSTLVLSKDMKVYEYRRKELVHFINLQDSRLKNLSTELKDYQGPTSSFLRKEATSNEAGSSKELDCTMLYVPEELQIAFGKYIWMQEKVYVFVHCWKLLLVLYRPKENGANFELVAEHEAVSSFKMVIGPIPYQAIVELQFENGKKMRTDFQTDTQNDEPSTSAGGPPEATESFKELLEQINTLEAELSAARQQTQKDFALWQDQQLFGSPAQRSLLLEEKQVVHRFGEVWMRVCGDFLICGTLLINLTGINRLNIVYDLKPLVRIEPPKSFRMHHRLFELPVQPDGQPPEDFDKIAQFWACQEQQSRRFKWRAVSKDGQLPPERSAVMLVRLSLSDLIDAEKLQLMAIYDIKSSKDAKDSESRQLNLITVDVPQLLAKLETLTPTFLPKSLHQDFLTVIMTQEAQCVLKLKFKEAHDCGSFEEQLISKMHFELFEVQDKKEDQEMNSADSDILDASILSTSRPQISTPVQRIFYNRKPHSQWFGILILRDDPGHYWHIYAPTETRLQLLVHHLKRDLLLLNCNVTLMDINEYISEPDNVALELENSLREELLAWKDLLENKDEDEEDDEEEKMDKYKSKLSNIHRLQFTSDVLVTMLRSQDAHDSDTEEPNASS
ncbi:uncharacterized protein [Drosophila bipectinata]|uniref:uncharacterized protein n=1 Tax=Drosophila bipectinata TaxID=42026 RepID=UPI001C898659|nr:uncharacterized protein LOC108122700 [Drosophila bipectinata]